MKVHVVNRVDGFGTKYLLFSFFADAITDRHRFRFTIVAKKRFGSDFTLGIVVKIYCKHDDCYRW